MYILRPTTLSRYDRDTPSLGVFGKDSWGGRLAVLYQLASPLTLRHLLPTLVRSDMYI
jgi:hypothetical protein